MICLDLIDVEKDGGHPFCRVGLSTGGVTLVEIVLDDESGSASIDSWAAVVGPGTYTLEAIADGRASGGRYPEGAWCEATFSVELGVHNPCVIADIDGSGVVGFEDILAILSAWGNAGGPEDLDGSGVVDFGDLLVVLGSWGPCP